MKKLKHINDEAPHPKRIAGDNLLDFTTQYDELLPVSDDPIIRFYVTMIKVYLGLYEGKLDVEQALRIVETQKKNPEFVKFATNPVLIPIDEEFKNKIIENLKTIKRYGVVSVDAIRSAYTFAFLTKPVQISNIAIKVIKQLCKDPLITNKEIARRLGVSAQRVSQVIRDLKPQTHLRFTCHIDTSAFGLNWIVIFFTLREDADWSVIYDAFATFPFTKYIYKTSLSGIGYTTFIIPGDESNLATFISEVKKIAPLIFSDFNIHIQVGQGTNTNIDLFQNGKWLLPEEVKDSNGVFKAYAECGYFGNKGIDRHMTARDFFVASELKIDYRATTAEIQKRIASHGIESNQQQISRSLNKLKRKKIVKPYITFTNIGLNSNFCFEIICEEEAREIVLHLLALVPKSTYFVTDKGFIAWIQSPSEHQVEYYSRFMQLERDPGIKSMKSIMTVTLTGSRAITDMIDGWVYTKRGWTVRQSRLQLAEHIMQYLDGAS